MVAITYNIYDNSIIRASGRADPVKSLQELRTQNSKQDLEILDKEAKIGRLIGVPKLFKVWCVICGASFDNKEVHKHKTDEKTGVVTVYGPRCNRRTANEERLE